MFDLAFGDVEEKVKMGGDDKTQEAIFIHFRSQCSHRLSSIPRPLFFSMANGRWQMADAKMSKCSDLNTSDVWRSYLCH